MADWHNNAPSQTVIRLGVAHAIGECSPRGDVFCRPGCFHHRLPVEAADDDTTLVMRVTSRRLIAARDLGLSDVGEDGNPSLERFTRAVQSLCKELATFLVHAEVACYRITRTEFLYSALTDDCEFKIGLSLPRAC